MTQEEPKPAPRLADELLELYIKIGGYIGVSLAVLMFLLICGFSYWLFIIHNFAHIHSAGLDIFIVIATFFTAGTTAIGTFFCASVFWLPIIIGLCFFCSMAYHLLQNLHHP